VKSILGQIYFTPLPAALEMEDCLDDDYSTGLWLLFPNKWSIGEHETHVPTGHLSPACLIDMASCHDFSPIK